MDSETERRIRERAYEIWVKEGRQHGRDAEHWEQARAEILAEADAAQTHAGGPETPPRPQSAPPPAASDAPLRSRRVDGDPPSRSEPIGGSAAAKPKRGRKA
jgi:hypothetical protein